MTYGEIAYDAYCNVTAYKSVITGDDLPSFWLLPETVKDAWEVAANAAIKEYWDRR